MQVIAIIVLICIAYFLIKKYFLWILAVGALLIIFLLFPSRKGGKDERGSGRQDSEDDEQENWYEPQKFYPSKNGLLPHEILMLSYAPKYKTTKNSFPAFWSDTYGVNNPQKLLKSLHSRGYIRPSTAKESLDLLKVTELKEILKAFELKVSGKKEDLISRIADGVSEEELSKYVPDCTYTLTDLGKRELEENEYIVFIHKNNTIYIDLQSVNKSMHDAGLSWKDAVWSELDQSSLNYFKDASFGLYRNTRLAMYEFRMYVGSPESAFLLLCEVAAYDLRGDDNWKREYLFPYERSMITLLPAIIKYLSDMQETLGMTDAEYREALIKQFSKIKLSRRVFTNEECADIVLNEISGDKEKLSEIYKAAEKRMLAAV